jgi:signal transduction histidine kinase
MVAADRTGTANAGAPGSGAGDGRGRPGSLRPAAASAHVLLAVARAPFTARSRRELVFCVAEIPFVLPVPLAVGWAAAAAFWFLTPGHPPNPTWLDLVGAGLVLVTVTALLVATGASRAIGASWRMLAARLLGAQVAAPPPLSRQGTSGRLRTGVRDGPGWRAVAYLLVKLPVALLGCYAVFFWVFGLVNLSFPVWWLSFRNHSPGVRLNPVSVHTPFDWAGQGHFTVATFPGTFAAAATGAAMLLAAPWVTRAAASADRWLIAALLGPGKLAQRVHERDLHDGAQVRLATLAMNLGMAREKLGGAGDVPDADAARELVDTALRDAREAIGELRHLARGIHPPVLDNGLADALTTLAAGSAIPAELDVSIPVRPTPAIETIAYFCAAELLANAVKHSSASKIKISASGDAAILRLSVSDNGTGGADPACGSGLSGLRQRVAMVDGSLAIASPADGGTQVIIELPLRP